MKKLLGIVVLGLLWCNISFGEILTLKCSQDYERVIGKSKFDKYWLPKPKIFFKFDLDARQLISYGIGDHRKEVLAPLQYWKNEQTKNKLLRGIAPLSGKVLDKQRQYRIYAFTIFKTPSKKYSYELVGFRVSKIFFNEWKSSLNKTYQALEEKIDFSDEFLINETSGLLKGSCNEET